jgi:putative tryptophan/tyrosine transport system substrate-binding protein
MNRRDLITLLGGTVVAWPLAARAQQTSRVPRVGLLFPGTETVAPARIAALREGLGAVGYREPDQVELIIRVTGGDPSRVLDRWPASSSSATCTFSSRSARQPFRP